MRLDKKLKKKLLLNAPYVLFVYLFDKAAQGISKTSKAGLPSWEKNGRSCLHKRRRRKRHFFPIC